MQEEVTLVQLQGCFVQAAAQDGGSHSAPASEQASCADSFCLAAQDGVIKDLVLLASIGVRPVLVHGGGPEINTWLKKLGIEAQFKNGLRVTDGGSWSILLA